MNSRVITREAQESLERLEELKLARDGYRVASANKSSPLAVGLKEGSKRVCVSSPEEFSERTIELRDSTILPQSDYVGTTFMPPRVVIMSTKSNGLSDATKTLILDSIDKIDWYKIAFLVCSSSELLHKQFSMFEPFGTYGLLVAKNTSKPFEHLVDSGVVSVSGGRLSSENPLKNEEFMKLLEKAGISVTVQPRASSGKES